jgi:hypothetical protein
MNLFIHLLYLSFLFLFLFSFLELHKTKLYDYTVHVVEDKIKITKSNLS